MREEVSSVFAHEKERLPFNQGVEHNAATWWCRVTWGRDAGAGVSLCNPSHVPYPAVIIPHGNDVFEYNSMLAGRPHASSDIRRRSCSGLKENVIFLTWAAS